MAPLAIVNRPAVDVVRPPTLPAPFQLPPVTPRVPAIWPEEEKLITPVAVRVALPPTVPEPVSAVAARTATVLPAFREPFSSSVPTLRLVTPV